MTIKTKTKAPPLGLYPLAEAARMVGMHPGSVRKRLIEGRSDAYLIGGVWLFTKAQVDALRREAKPQPKRIKRADGSTETRTGMPSAQPEGEVTA